MPQRSRVTIWIFGGLALLAACTQTPPQEPTATKARDVEREAAPLAAKLKPATAPAEPLAEAATKVELDVASQPTTVGDKKDRRSRPEKNAERAERADDALLGLMGDAMGHGGGAVGQGTIGLGKFGASRGGGGLALAAAPAAQIAVAPPSDFDTEAYAHIADHSFLRVQDTPLSTFSIDVDTASYSNVRRFLRDGQRPPADAVRIEELVNYFRYDDPAPVSDVPFSVRTEVSAAPWSPKHRLVRIGIRGRDIATEQVPARNLVFLVDVSGSMDQPDKLPLLKHGLGMLARNLRPQDHIAIVVYAGASGLALPTTPGSAQGRILEALDSLQPGGSTNGAEGIELAYRLAREGFIAGGINRVILATDGDFNVGVTSQGELVRLIEERRKSGVFLTVLGFGTGNLKDSTMEALADHGNGNYAYIDSPAEAQKVLVREAGSTLVTIAKDVKLQVELNPARVASYRLIGYENRVLANRDFNDDKKDAGEIGAGHSVTALYEIELIDAGSATTPEIDPLKYQAARAPTTASQSEELMTVKVRYKAPNADTSLLLSHAVRDTGKKLDETSADFRWSTAVAAFGMLLRNSEHKGDTSLSMVLQLARSALGRDVHGDRREFVELIERAREMGVGQAG